MKNFHYECQRFKNGNLNIRFSPDEIADIKVGKCSAVELLNGKLGSLDTSFIGEEYCLSNYTLGCTLYCGHDGNVFVLDFSDIDSILMNGRTLKLYANEPTPEDLEQIEEVV